MNNTIIQEMIDLEYQDAHSQLSREQRKLCNWQEFKWGKDSDGNLYWKGIISGKSCPDWTLARRWNMPFTEADILRVAKFLQS